MRKKDIKTGMRKKLTIIKSVGMDRGPRKGVPNQRAQKGIRRL